MIHQFQDKKQIIRKKKIIRNVIGFGVFFIFIILGVLTWSGKMFNFIGRPIWEVERSISNVFYNSNFIFRNKSSLTKENHNLIQDLADAKLSMIDYQILKNENEQLKETLGRMPSTKNFILANILAKPNHSPYDTIIIDIGSSSGINEGDMVYVNGNIPIGNIGKVYNNTALISLYTSPSEKTEGFMDGSNASVELTGRGGGNFEMIVPIELQADKGTIIYLPGNTNEVIALVDDIISKPSDPFKKVLLSSPVNIQNLKWVEVKKN